MIDAKDVPIYQLPYSEILEMVQLVRRNLKWGMNHIVIVNVHWAITLAVNTVLKLLPQNVSSKVHCFQGNG